MQPSSSSSSLLTPRHKYPNTTSVNFGGYLRERREEGSLVPRRRNFPQPLPQITYPMPKCSSVTDYCDQSFSLRPNNPDGGWCFFPPLSLSVGATSVMTLAVIAFVPDHGPVSAGPRQREGTLLSKIHQPNTPP